MKILIKLKVYVPLTIAGLLVTSVLAEKSPKPEAEARQTNDSAMQHQKQTKGTSNSSDTSLPDLKLPKPVKTGTMGEERLKKMQRRHESKIKLIKKQIEAGQISKKEGARQLKEQKKIHQMEKKELIKEINNRGKLSKKQKKENKQMKQKKKTETNSKPIGQKQGPVKNRDEDDN